MLKIRPMGPNIGGEITGVDVKNLDDSGFVPIYKSWLKYGVTVVRNQELEIADFIRYSQRYGPVLKHPSQTTRHPDHPEITMLGINKFDPSGNLIKAIYGRGAGGFHTDGAYEEVPYKATQLYALAIPSSGGDTHFSSMYMTYDALPARLKILLEGRKAAYTFSKQGAMQALNEKGIERPLMLHLMMPTHPETGRRSVYFDPLKIRYVEGLEKHQSDDVIAELKEIMIQPGAGYSHKWQVGDIVIWDNRCLVHKAAGDYPPEEERIHWRVSIEQTVTKT
ncbi:MAG: TauD/TfdA dioxygenase family protein [Rhodospirillales bacterium]|jgi:taurine dioxygenase